MIEIKRYLNKNDAYLDKSLLESHGVFCEVSGDDLGFNAPHMSYNFNIRLLVNASDKEQALKILNETILIKDSEVEFIDDHIKDQRILSQRVKHALNSAIISFLFPLVANFFSIYSLIKIIPNFIKLNTTQKNKVLLSIILNFFILVFYFVLIFVNKH